MLEGYRPYYWEFLFPASDSSAHLHYCSFHSHFNQAQPDKVKHLETFLAFEYRLLDLIWSFCFPQPIIYLNTLRRNFQHLLVCLGAWIIWMIVTKSEFSVRFLWILYESLGPGKWKGSLPGDCYRLGRWWDSDRQVVDRLLHRILSCSSCYGETLPFSIGKVLEKSKWSGRIIPLHMTWFVLCDW